MRTTLSLHVRAIVFPRDNAVEQSTSKDNFSVSWRGFAINTACAHPRSLSHISQKKRLWHVVNTRVN